MTAARIITVKQNEGRCEVECQWYMFVTVRKRYDIYTTMMLQSIIINGSELYLLISRVFIGGEVLIIYL